MVFSGLASLLVEDVEDEPGFALLRHRIDLQRPHKPAPITGQSLNDLQSPAGTIPLGNRPARRSRDAGAGVRRRTGDLRGGRPPEMAAPTWGMSRPREGRPEHPDGTLRRRHQPPSGRGRSNVAVLARVKTTTVTLPTLPPPDRVASARDQEQSDDRCSEQDQRGPADRHGEAVDGPDVHSAAFWPGVMSPAFAQGVREVARDVGGGRRSRRWCSAGRCRSSRRPAARC